MEAIIFTLAFAAIAFLAFLSLKYFDKRLTYGFGFLFAAYIGLDDLATALPSIAHFFDPVGGQWNWSGKIYSLLVSFLVIIGLGLNAKAIGLSLPQRNISVSLIALIALTLVGLVLGFVFQPSPPSAETLAFQALMPALAEELVYRGIAPALLLGLIRGREFQQGTPWAVVCITAVVFGVWHGLSLSNGVFSFDQIHALYTFIGSIVYGWLRFSSGSLLFPVLAHSLGNTAFQLTALL